MNELLILRISKKNAPNETEISCWYKFDKKPRKEQKELIQTEQT